jgi:hypothetical protein
MGVIGQSDDPYAFYPRGKDPRYKMYRSLGGSQSRSGHRGYKKILCLCRGSNLDIPVVLSIALHYTVWATRLHKHIISLQVITAWNREFLEKLADPRLAMKHPALYQPQRLNIV